MTRYERRLQAQTRGRSVYVPRALRSRLVDAERYVTWASVPVPLGLAVGAYLVCGLHFLKDLPWVNAYTVAWGALWAVSLVGYGLALSHQRRVRAEVDRWLAFAAEERAARLSQA